MTDHLKLKLHFFLFLFILSLLTIRLSAQEITDLIHTVHLTAGQTDSVLISDEFYAKNYGGIKFIPNKNVKVSYDTATGMARLYRADVIKSRQESIEPGSKPLFIPKPQVSSSVRKIERAEPVPVLFVKRIFNEHMVTKKIKEEIEIPEHRLIYQLGETFGSYKLVNSYVNDGQLIAQFNFNLYDVAMQTFLGSNTSFKTLDNEIHKSFSVFGANNLMGNIMDSHDKVRFMAFADGEVPLNGGDASEIG